MPKSSSQTPLKTCDLCCDTLEPNQDTLLCEGGCGCNVHRYCAGVTRNHYAELTASTTPFVCQFCALKTFRATVQLLQSEVEGLRSELADARALIKQQPALPQGTQGSYEAKSYAAAASSDEEKRCSIQGQGKRKKQGKPAAPSGHGNSESVGNSQSPRPLLCWSNEEPLR